MKKQLKWIGRSLEGKDGNASSRKITALLFGVTTLVLIYADLLFDKTVGEPLILGTLCITVISLGLMTAQNIVDIFKRPSNSYFDNEIYNPNNRISPNPDDEQL